MESTLAKLDELTQAFQAWLDNHDGLSITPIVAYSWHGPTHGSTIKVGPFTIWDDVKAELPTLQALKDEFIATVSDYLPFLVTATDADQPNNPDVEKAACAFSAGCGIVLAAVGPRMEPLVGEDGPRVEELPFGDDAPDHGIWIWEGTLYWAGDAFEGELSVRSGSWRPTTEKERVLLATGHSPWQPVSTYGQPTEISGTDGTNNATEKAG